MSIALTEALEELLSWLKSKRNIFFFCDNNINSIKRLVCFCGLHNIAYSGVISEDDTMFQGVNIVTVDEIRKIADKIDVISSEKVLYNNILLNDIMNVGFCSIYNITQKMEYDLYQYLIENYYNNKSNNYFADLYNSCVEGDHLIIRPKDGGDYLLCRAEINELSAGGDVFLNECNFESLKEEYGDLTWLPHNPKERISNSIFQKGDIALYVMHSHLDDSVPEKIEKEGFIPLQVGTSLANIRKGGLADDDGDSISEKNRDYCECTGIYWIWRNTVGQKYVGINHYRRRLALDDRSIHWILDNKVDMVFALPHFSLTSVKEFFYRFVTKKDWELMKQFAAEYDSAYEKCMEIYERGHFLFPCNICLFKREIFDKYCEFAFFVAEKIGKYYNGRDVVRNDRYMGFLFENMQSVFAIRHKDELKIAYSEFIWKRQEIFSDYAKELILNGFIAQLRSKKKFFIYGAGKIGKEVVRNLAKRGIIPNGIVVSNTAGNAERIGDIPVRSLHEISVDNDTMFLLATALSAQKEIILMLKQNGFFNYIAVDWTIRNILKVDQF